MDQIRTKYLLLHIFAGPLDGSGVGFALITCQSGAQRSLLEAHEFAGWRDRCNPRDLAYLEELLASVRTEVAAPDAIFSMLENLAASFVRVVDEGYVTPENLSRLLAT